MYSNDGVELDGIKKNSNVKITLSIV